MAIGYLPEPGDEYGPCVDEACGHVDCAQTRRMRQLLCSYCHEPIESRGFFNDSPPDEPWTRLVHAACAARQQQAKQATRRLLGVTFDD